MDDKSLATTKVQEAIYYARIMHTPQELEASVKGGGTVKASKNAARCKPRISPILPMSSSNCHSYRSH